MAGRELHSQLCDWLSSCLSQRWQSQGDRRANGCLLLPALVRDPGLERRIEMLFSEPLLFESGLSCPIPVGITLPFSRGEVGDGMLEPWGAVGAI